MSHKTNKILLIFCDGTGQDGTLSSETSKFMWLNTHPVLIKTLTSDENGNSSGVQEATNVLRLCMSRLSMICKLDMELTGRPIDSAWCAAVVNVRGLFPTYNTTYSCLLPEMDVVKSSFIKVESEAKPISVERAPMGRQCWVCIMAAFFRVIVS